ncbi:hybrid sensor histidine kinase/response regulator [Alcaligenes endophyticus]|uniref:histidine kinase n=1 Tax=Alcaligenes endophyticus TaxID=1929088 RepID=A0ABT8EGM8_9BURK|nr:PAS domain-containing hybrid sensor histidine kinase/response regulator [Alcaligenes endophyticus]MCX5589914.1 PAS domain-containing hybrid sensor histidine kinase/response regulator [Alcaligenes endophyticus]MDN4120423.1 hybrid sensor histidine kinase/response regulator [Alcaligenes endophyticus]
MVPAWVILASLVYAAILFAIAWIGDRRPLYPQRGWLRPLVYSLALAVYCSSWTFYGAVGSAMRDGMSFLPIYLGPILMFLFGWRILERLALVAQTQKTTSIADFIASRYGRAQRLAALVAFMAVVAAVPYLALQYKAVTLSLRVMTNTPMNGGVLGDPALYVAVGMALFSILFGTRVVDATEHRPGLMLAVAFESLVKLLALIAVGVFAMFWFQKSQLDLTGAVQTFLDNSPRAGFVSQTLLAFLAIICLPRQFHVAIVECADVRDIRRARWLFGGYLIIVSLMVLPIATVGMSFVTAQGTAPDTFVLALPLSEGQLGLALAVYIGGFSAATGMVIVTSVALATMVSNDLIMPLLLRARWAQKKQGNMAATVLWVRRVAIMVLAGAAYGYYRISGTDTALAAYGLMAFVAVAQFAPGLIGGLYWRGASRQGVEAGLLLGFAIWVYTLFLPTVTEAGWLDDYWLHHGLFGVSWLRPHQLLGVDGLDPLTHGTFWSLACNIAAFLWVSWRRQPGLGERLHAEPFLNPYAQRQTLTAQQWQGSLTVGDLLTLASRITGDKTALRAFQAHALTQQGQALSPEMKADTAWVQFTELLLAAAVGAASARLVITSALRGSGMELNTVVAVLDEAGQALRFNRDILLATLENIDQGISVVDADMRLLAWNQSYQSLWEYPVGMLYVGRPVEDLLRLNASRGELFGADENEVEQAIQRRLTLMREGKTYIKQRILNDKKVIELRGRPLSGGGYVTSYSDITHYKNAERELRDMNETLEQRVAERTQEAEKAQELRTKFLTAVSHDVLQPINAARLFASALSETQEPQEMTRLSERIDTALRSAEELLDGLLDISRLDAGVWHPEIEQIYVPTLLHNLADQYAPIAVRRNIQLAVHAPAIYVRSDPRLLRRVLQNFLANALRYTRSGRIILGVRRRGAELEFQVWDSGQGIPEQHIQQIYSEFHRYEQPFDWDGRGLGMGLSICQRIASLLHHRLNVASQVGRGSMFSIWVPRVSKPVLAMTPATSEPTVVSSLEGLRVLCLDNDPEIIEGMLALLSRWGINSQSATTVDQALAQVSPDVDVLLVDYHLHDRLNGLEALELLTSQLPHVRGALLTADGSHELKAAARERGYPVLTKPVKPASLRAFLLMKLEERNSAVGV